MSHPNSQDFIKVLNMPLSEVKHFLKVNSIPHITSQEFSQVVNSVSNSIPGEENVIEMNNVPHSMYHDNVSSFTRLMAKKNSVEESNTSDLASAEKNTKLENSGTNSVSEQQQIIKVKKVPYYSPSNVLENVPCSTFGKKNTEVGNVTDSTFHEKNTQVLGMSSSISEEQYLKEHNDLSYSICHELLTDIPNLMLKGNNIKKSCESPMNSQKNIKTVSSQHLINYAKKQCQEKINVSTLESYGENIEKINLGSCEINIMDRSGLPYSITNEFVRLYFEERNILVCEDFKKNFPNAEILKGSTISIIVSGKKVFVTLVCFLCSVIDYSRFTLENKSHEIRFALVNGQYYLICKFCRLLLDWNCQKLINDTIYFKQINYFCKWDCGKSLSVEKVYDHEKKCEKQLLQECPIQSCNAHLKFFELDKHLKQLHTEILPPFGYLVYTFYGGTIVKLKCSRSPFKQLFVQSHIPVLVDFIWEKSFWKIILSCKISNLKLRAVIIDEHHEFVAFIKERGIISHLNQIHLKCYFADPKKEEFEKKIEYTKIASSEISC